MAWNNFPDTAKVWLYQADRFLTETEIHWLTEQIDAFTREWAAHGTQLRAAGTVLKNAVILLAVDQAAHEASGCSIDASVRFIKQMGKELEVDFFNRLKPLTRMEDEQLAFVSYAQLKDRTDVLPLDLTVQQLGEVNSYWLQ